MHLCRRVAVASALLLLAGLAIGVRAWDPHVIHPWFVLAIGLSICGFLALACTLLTLTVCSSKGNIDAAYEAGYDAGYAKGRRTTRPTIVRLPRTPTGRGHDGVPAPTPVRPVAGHHSRPSGA